MSPTCRCDRTAQPRQDTTVADGESVPPSRISSHPNARRPCDSMCAASWPTIQACSCSSSAQPELPDALLRARVGPPTGTFGHSSPPMPMYADGKSAMTSSSTSLKKVHRAVVGVEDVVRDAPLRPDLDRALRVHAELRVGGEGGADVPGRLDLRHDGHEAVVA